MKAAPARPSKSQIRAAHEQALQGVRLAQQGQHALAIARLKRRSRSTRPSRPCGTTSAAPLWRPAATTRRWARSDAPCRSNSKLASAYDHLGVLFDRHGRVDDAFKAYAAAVNLEPQRHVAQFRLGQMLMHQGRRGDAAARFAPRRRPIRNDVFADLRSLRRRCRRRGGEGSCAAAGGHRRQTRQCPSAFDARADADAGRESARPPVASNAASRWRRRWLRPGRLSPRTRNSRRQTGNSSRALQPLSTGRTCRRRSGRRCASHSARRMTTSATMRRRCSISTPPTGCAARPRRSTARGSSS